MMRRARCSGALSIHRLEGSRPRLRRTRALCKFNGGKVGRRGAPKLCGEAQRTAPRGLELEVPDVGSCSQSFPGDSEWLTGNPSPILVMEELPKIRESNPQPI